MKRVTLSFLIIALTLQGGGLYVFAQEQTHDEINVLNDEIEARQQTIEQLDSQIESYQQKIDAEHSKEASLYSEIDLIENRIAKTKLDIAAAEEEINLVNAQISLIEYEIHDLEDQIESNLARVGGILQEIDVQDNSLPIYLLFGTDSLSDIFASLEELRTVSSDLKSAVEDAKSSRKLMLEKRESQKTKKGQLEELSENLAQEKHNLESSIEAKETLLAQTQESEAQFQQLLADVRQEQVYINQQISLLQKEIEDKLDSSDTLGDSSVLSWPIDPTIRGISTYFHDPTYPFRNLFEHSGLDLPAPYGTAIKAAAPGYVAWTRQGRMYGNYVMIIHSNGIATLYAHMSRIDVVPDQFVSRADTIGAVGSTGFSTGPHLHFEVRLNGIPSDPLNYLISY